jgi:hypothetical protein
VTDFARCFLLVFGQLAAGGFVALSRLPFHEIERGFYKSTAAVYLASAGVLLAGQLALLGRGVAPASPGAMVEAGIWLAFTAAAAVYLASLWGDPYRRRALAYVATVVLALLAVVTSALRYSPAPLLSLETILYPASFLVSALLLGATATGMLLGHWYLIDVGMPLAPLVRIWRLYRTSLLVQLVTLAVCLTGFHLVGIPATRDAVTALWSDYRLLLWMRLGIGPLAALGIAWMIWRTLAIPQTMAATGLFYVAVLATVVGEFLGRFLLFRTTLPL